MPTFQIWLFCGVFFFILLDVDCYGVNGLNRQSAQVSVVVALFVEIGFHLFDVANRFVDCRAKHCRFDVDDDRKLPSFGEGDGVCFHC